MIEAFMTAPTRSVEVTGCCAQGEAHSAPKPTINKGSFMLRRLTSVPHSQNWRPWKVKHFADFSAFGADAGGPLDSVAALGLTPVPPFTCPAGQLPGTAAADFS